MRQNNLRILGLLLLLLGVSLINAREIETLEENKEFAIDLIDLFDKYKLVIDSEELDFDTTVTSDQLVDEMGFGWNLGNTLDAWNNQVPSQNEGISSETIWGNPETTEEMIRELIMKGIRTLRVPVTWHNHLIDEKYTIDPEWMERVKTVVDWGLNNGMYVILNTHHDNAGQKESPISYGEGYYPLKKDMEESERFIYNVWKQIATAFNNGYDHHLIFEGLNEPRLLGNEYEWWYKVGEPICEQAADVLNEYMRLIVKAIRETGGNNAKRFIMVTPLAAAYQCAIDSNFVFPDDTKYNSDNSKILLSVHMYTPYNFALNGDMTYVRFEDAYKEELYEDFATLYKRFISNGHHVVIGETGTVDKNNTEDRLAWAEYFVKTSRQFHMCSVLWDNNYYDNTVSASEVLGQFQRDKLTWKNDELIDMHVAFAATSFNKIDASQLYAIELKETYDENKIVTDEGSNKFDDSVTAEQLVESIGMGWNLGNTLDAYYEPPQGYNDGLSSENVWGNPTTTEEMIKGIAIRGFKTLRVPVSWHNHLIDERYTIDPEWMKRVKTVVNWGLKYGLNVILNSHHDNLLDSFNNLKYGQGYYPLKRDIKESEKFIFNIWKQIAAAFNNGYDHHLIFEGLNEPRLAGNDYEWWYKAGEPVCIEAASVLNEYMRLIVKAIRETGGNNEKRFIMLTPLAASYQVAMESDFVFPDDTKYNSFRNRKLILSVHMYTPYEFALSPDMTVTKFGLPIKNELEVDFSNLYSKFVANGIQVIIGEMGTVNKNNTQDRIDYAKFYVTAARKYHLSTIVWDNGIYDKSVDVSQLMGEYHRNNLTWENDKLIDAYLRGSKTPFYDYGSEFAISLQDKFDKKNIVNDTGNVKFNESVSPDQLVEEMGFGWNLGNALDAFNVSSTEYNEGLSSETVWGNPETTEKMIQALVEKGIKTIRIPITWHNHFIDENYTIDPKWMKRVKTIVNWAMIRGMYVIINSHHDNSGKKEETIPYGSGYYPLIKDITESERFIYNVWRQIAIAFNNGYDHHLIFEGLNEPRLSGHQYEWNYEKGDEDCEEAATVLNDYMKLIVKTIRETGGNNKKRFIMVTPLAASYQSALYSNFIFPDDRAYNKDYIRILLSVHMYTPYMFALNKDMNYTKFEEAYKEELYEDFATLYKKFTYTGHSVIIGETGTVNKNNTEDRLAWAEYFVRKSRYFHMCTILWDNNAYDNSISAEEIIGSFHRDTLTWDKEELIDTYLKESTSRFEEIDVRNLFSIEAETTYNKTVRVKDQNFIEFNDSVTAEEISEAVGMGWNLGNALDAFNDTFEGLNEGLSSENDWGNPTTTEEMIKEIAKKGFKSLRVPVSWHNHLIDEKYTIDPEWMLRVKTVVDWGIKYGLYVILNSHHDNLLDPSNPLIYGEGYYPSKRDIKESEKFIFNIWKQISVAFNAGYDQHLIFEGLNEPRLAGTPYEWHFIDDEFCLEATEVLNEFMKLIVKAIRESGDNNKKRFILITPLAASYEYAVESNVVFPDDTKYNSFNKGKLLLSVHMYTPYDFTLNPDMKFIDFTQKFMDELDLDFSTLYKKYIMNNIQVIIGEMGTINKNNTDARIAWADYYVTNARKYHLSSILWDNGHYDNSIDYYDAIGEFRRKELKWENDKLIDTYIQASLTKFHDFNSDFEIKLEDKFYRISAIEDPNRVDFDNTISSDDLVNEMGFGWNLGNSLDAFDINSTELNEGLYSEIEWKNPNTTEDMIKGLVKKGIKTIRIPVTWHNHLIDENYTIDPLWMRRVIQVVNWGIKNGLYVILNTHHDNSEYTEDSISYGKGYYPLEKDIEESERFIYNIWRQITLAFNNGYDHHLIFEGLNEPRLAGNEYEYYYNSGKSICREAAQVLNELNRLVVTTIRMSGGNNQKRFIMVTPLGAGFHAAINSPFVFPSDLEYNNDNSKILLSLHMFIPYNFVKNSDMTYTKFEKEYKDDLYEDFVSLYMKFINKGHNVIISETGTVNKNNTEDRLAWAKYFISTARKFHMASVLWDNNVFDNSVSSNEVLGQFHRETLSWENDELIDAHITSAGTAFQKIDVDQIYAIDLIDSFNKTNLIEDQGDAALDNSYSAEELSKDIGLGWNLGNTLDAYDESATDYNEGLSSENVWGNPNTTEEMIKGLIQRGFKTIRIPVTWHNHLIDENYTIDPAWMKRVKTIVNYGLKYGLNVILNSHHDNLLDPANPLKYGQGYYPLQRDIRESERFIYNIWRQIVIAFNKGYDHHLIFEGLNEPRLAGNDYEWWYKSDESVCIEAANVLNQYMKLIVKVIRESGGNNEKRFIMVTPLAAAYQTAMESNFFFPDDTKYNAFGFKKIILSVHMYTPYNFALNPNMSYVKFDEACKGELEVDFKNLYNKYIQNGIQVIIGETGTLNKNNNEDRLAWADYYVTNARKYHMSSIIWDNGIYDKNADVSQKLGEYHRNDLTWENDELIDTYLRASKTPFYNFENDFVIKLEDKFDKTNLVVDTDELDFDNSITSEQLVNEMGFGWNLGNSFDAVNGSNTEHNDGLSSETCWGNPETTEEMIKAIVARGIKTIRIPVSWHNHLIDENYTIDPKWMKRVKTVVDWAIKNGLFVIINIHHDNAGPSENSISYGKGFYPLEKHMVESEKFIYNVWRQIATAFNNGYDHHLIFEGLNEPRLAGTNYEWNFDKTNSVCKEAAYVLNEYMRLIVRAIRTSGGNNRKRFIMVTPLAASYQSAIDSEFEFPDDSAYNKYNSKIILSVHMYTPYMFALNKDMNYTKFEEAYKEELYEDFATLYKKFTYNGHNVIIGETGTVNKNNTEDRLAWADYFVHRSRKFHMCTILWDNNAYDNSISAEEIIGSFHRDTLTWDKEEIMDVYIKRAETPFEEIDVRNLFSIETETTYNKTVRVKDQNFIEFNDSVTAEEISEAVGMGWNLGNALDAFNETFEGLNEGLSSENDWGNPTTTEEMIEGIAKKGFKSLRIPVSWHNHLIDEKYTIDPQWMLRVKKIVDWGIKYGLYVILNSHHDNLLNPTNPLTYGEGYYPSKRDIKESEKFIFNIWKQISVAFNAGYDQHLIFEGLNEPRLAGTSYEWHYIDNQPLCLEGTEVLNEFMRLIVKAIRESGDNNKKRFILITPLAASYEYAVESNVVFPDDTKYNSYENRKLLLSVHLYSPYDFTLNPDMKFIEFTQSFKDELDLDFSTLYNKYILNNVQVIIGEMGTVNKNNTEARIAWAEYYVSTARKYHLSSILWDNGHYDNSINYADAMGEYHRSELKWENVELIDTYLKASLTPFQ